tara:strand:- start:516 stop:1766 length:1251 start_codon:yes stop_codon:yes gene_type:complete
MDKIVIEGMRPLSGTVKISGAKNAVLPIMTAALIPSGISRIKRVPKLRDTYTMIRLLEIVGANVVFNGNTLEIDSTNVDNPEAPYDLVKTMRASFYILGPLMARFGRVKVSMPGGCAWGPRPVDFHLKGLERLGAKLTLKEGYILAEAEQLQGNEIRLEFPSVGATGNLAMAAATANGTTVIYNAAREPEIVQLCEFLNKMGASISGIGSETLIIDGVNRLHPTDIKVIPDRIETGTFLIAGALLGGITVKDIEIDHLDTVLGKLKDVGCKISIRESSITLEPPDKIKPVDMTTAVYPGFPTDLQAQWVALMSLADGSSTIKDTVYHDRFSHIPELARLGANIQVNHNTAFVRGVDSLVGAPVMSTDIRASASLIIAGLAASGETEVSRVYHIDRGYERIEEKFRHLGANISREHG